ncbi:MAG: tRNA uridine-5-carboxymethylaminomethyl(34) synthesis GTPase MnmE [Gammaproteobacteria bacterium]
MDLTDITSGDETIVAVATPPGRGGVGIVRVSGPLVKNIAEQIIGSLPQPRIATGATFRDAEREPMDQGLALFFAGPASFTGEDVLELHGHGGPVPMDMLVQRCVELGARVAQPGEFSKRAFLNDKIDLTQAEAISDLIDSASQQAARAAVRSLSGEFAQRIHELVTSLTELRMYVEAAIDFPEEEIDFLQDDELTRRVQLVEQLFIALQQDAEQGQLLRDGMVLVIAGPPNVGKSSLLNRLAGYDAAIVTARPGTTRDVLREDLHIDGMPLRVIDTAGLHESDDPIEQEGMRRARTAIKTADHVLLMSDAARPETFDLNVAELPAGVPVTRLVNKIDLLELATETIKPDSGEHVVFASAMTGEGVDELRKHLSECMGYSSVDGGKVIARRRHLQAIERAFAHMVIGREALFEQKAGEIMAEELRLAQQSLGEITGTVTSDDLLGHIFSSFCIGK